MTTARSRGHPAILAIVAVLLAAWARVGEAQRSTTSLGVITGTVADTALRPLGSADVVLVLPGSEATLHTDAAGRFRFTDVPARSYLLTVRHLGFKPVTTQVDVTGGDTLRLGFTLEPATQALGTVTVTEKARSVKMQEFDERRARGEGEFFTAADIEKRGAIKVEDVLRLAKAVKVVRNQNDGRQFAHSLRWDPSGKDLCPMQVFLDGVRLIGQPVYGPQGSGAASLTRSGAPTPGASGGGTTGNMAVADPVDLNNLPTPKDIAGIEVYSGPATVPAQYNSGASRWCGVILLWTKDR